MPNSAQRPPASQPDIAASPVPMTARTWRHSTVIRRRTTRPAPWLTRANRYHRVAAFIPAPPKPPSSSPSAVKSLRASSRPLPAAIVRRRRNPNTRLQRHPQEGTVPIIGRGAVPASIPRRGSPVASPPASLPEVRRHPSKTTSMNRRPTVTFTRWRRGDAAATPLKRAGQTREMM